MKKRDHCSVVLKMIECVPESETAFIEKLKWHIEDANPELGETFQWNLRVLHTLNEFISNPEEDWEFKLLGIFMEIPIEDLRRIKKEAWIV